MRIATRRPFALAGTTLLATIALLGVSTPAHAAATLTVGPTGTYATISAAIAAADPGDLITVADGLYVENITVAEGITIQAENPRAATIQGNVTLSAPANIGGFTIAPLSGIGVTVGAAGAGSQITNNTVQGTAQLIRVGSAVGSAGARTLVAGNTLQSFTGAAVFVSASSFVDVVGNTITNTLPIPAGSVGVNVGNGSTDVTVLGNIISNVENAIAVLSASAPALTNISITGNSISNTSNSAVVLANANLQGVEVSGNSFTDVGTSGPTRAAVQIGVVGLAAPNGSAGLDGLTIDGNTVANAPNGVVFSSNVVLVDNESAVVSDNTFVGLTGAAIAVDPAVAGTVSASGNDFGGAPVTGNVAVAAVAVPAGPGLAATGLDGNAGLIATAAALLMALGAVLLMRRRSVVR